jgi:hypothetical protein
MQRYLLLFATFAFYVHAGVAGARNLAVPGSGDAHPPTSVASADACSFQPPRPVLLPNSYPGQTLERQSDNGMTEKAQLNNGLRIEIRQSTCVDFLVTDFVLIIPCEQGRQRDRNAQLRLARSTIAGLKTRIPTGGFAELLDFLRRAPGLRLRDGSLGLCRDGSNAQPGECSWESMGGFVFSVKRSARGTRISVSQYLSG